jgi:arylsulfatase
MWNIGAYHRGMMAGRTPNLDKLAAEGMLFTDYYAEASCTAGRANFITGELPIRTGMTTVGQAGAPTGIPAQAVTIAQALKATGYATGQFGKNHLGDKNEFLPTVHGFDEFFGYLYHLDAMEDQRIPAILRVAEHRRSAQHGIQCSHQCRRRPWTRWGKSEQRIEDTSALYRSEWKQWTTNRDLIRSSSTGQADNKPFFLWLNRPHAHRHASRRVKHCAAQNNWHNEAGMAQLDEDVAS